MPKTAIDWTKTCIYKIYCNDNTITDCYIGRTTDFIRRKYSHMILCKKNKDLPVYSFINEHGGWNNWSIEIIEHFPCLDSIEAGNREKYWINFTEATLNIHLVKDNTIYKKEWYFKYQEKIRLHQEDYRNKNKKYKQELIIDNNPEWYLNNMNNSSIWNNIKQ